MTVRLEQPQVDAPFDSNCSIWRASSPDDVTHIKEFQGNVASENLPRFNLIISRCGPRARKVFPSGKTSKAGTRHLASSTSGMTAPSVSRLADSCRALFSPSGELAFCLIFPNHVAEYISLYGATRRPKPVMAGVVGQKGDGRGQRIRDQILPLRGRP